MNKYYPPEWEPKHGSINTFRGQHPLRDRAKKIKQGILVVRFEMPYNVWCEGCNSHIGKGVRYNAEKKQEGSYFSTKIWSFRMKCHLCSHWMEVRTDPQNHDYKMFSGVRRKEESRDINDLEDVVEGVNNNIDDDGLIKFTTEEEKEKRDSDPFAKLEHKRSDITKAIQVKPVIESLYDRQDRMFDDFGASQNLRKKFRDEKKEIQKLKEEAEDLGLSIPLLPKESVDLDEAKRVYAKKVISDPLRKEKSQKRKLKSTSIFASSSAYKSPSLVPLKKTKFN